MHLMLIPVKFFFNSWLALNPILKSKTHLDHQTMPELSWRATNYLKSFSFKFMEKVSRHHLRSNSDLARENIERDKSNTTTSQASYGHNLKEMGELNGRAERKKRQSPKAEIQNTLKKEILKLEEELQDQFAVRCALEKALSTRPSYYDITLQKSIPETPKELIKEIAALELEVAYLERYLLSLHRRTFNKEVSPSSTRDEKWKLTSETNEEMHQEVPELDIISDKESWVIQSIDFPSSRYSIGNLNKISDDICGPEKLFDSSIHRSHSSLSQRSACSVRTSPPKSLPKAVDSYHSLPLSMLEKSRMDTSGGTSLAEHLGTSISHHVPEAPNRLSEEMIKCISSIYCELADPPLISHDLLSSPISCSSSIEIISSQDQGDMWSPECGKFSSFNSHYGNPFSVGKYVEFSGPYCSMVKIQWICRDSKKLRDVEDKLQHYRLLVYQLEELDVRRLNHKEKLAFWINVHNALVMHAFLVYGIPKSSLKKVSLLVKAAYKVGGQIISVDMIQSSILGCRLPRPGQWLKMLFPSKTKFKAGDARKAYMIEHPEPRLYFALCSGSFSDPAVRIYTAKKVFEEMEAAKEDYIQSKLNVNREQKIELPKLMELFAKDSDLCPAGLVQMVEQYMPQCLRGNFQQSCLTKYTKCIQWIPHNFSFRYMLSRELA